MRSSPAVSSWSVVLAFAGPVAAQPVISQVYGGGGNIGATFTHDYIELFNPTGMAISLDGWSVQYASASGTGNFGFGADQITPLSGAIQPGRYLLIQGAEGAGGTTPLPTPDFTDPSPISISATGAKVALVRTTALLGCNGGSSPCSAAQLALIVDLVGWEDANFAEGSPGPATSNTTALFRANNGCTDTGNNAADFTTGPPIPRNSGATVNECGGPGGPAPGPPIVAAVLPSSRSVQVGTPATVFATIIISPAETQRRPGVSSGPRRGRPSGSRTRPPTRPPIPPPGHQTRRSISRERPRKASS